MADYALAPSSLSPGIRELREDEHDEVAMGPPCALPAPPLRRKPSTADPNFLSPNTFSSSSDLSFPDHRHFAPSSVCSTAATTPVHSRSTSPSPLFYSSAQSTCSSDTESDVGSPLLNHAPARLWWREPPSMQRRWWPMRSNYSSRRRRRARCNFGLRSFKRFIRNVCRRPFIPKQPLTILLTLLLLTSFGICLTLLIKHILDPDKEPLPWRLYCSIPSTSTAPPSMTNPISALPEYFLRNPTSLPPPFPPPDLDLLPSVGVFVGVFSLDSAFERRMMIRSTWANHKRSRNGGGSGDGGVGTSRTIVRFILGQPTRAWDRRVRLEMETYNDIVVLPMYENMNSGKSHEFFTWAASNAWVPPHYFLPSEPLMFSYSNATSPAPVLAEHDPVHARNDRDKKPWVRPDFVVKADDDSFVVLAEMESRLRVELYAAARPHNHTTDTGPESSPSVRSNATSAIPNSIRLTQSLVLVDHTSPVPTTAQDPLIYWGYLVKNRFMAGEFYALTWAIVDWVANDTSVKTMTKGAEDKQTAKWVMSHPRAQEVRWASEKCWIYDHPRAGTVYSHGFLFPAEVTRVKTLLIPYLDAPMKLLVQARGSTSDGLLSLQNLVIPSAWAHSSVSTFGTRYTPPIPDMTTWQTVEALVEGSDMSKLREDSPMTADYAWKHREGRDTRYQGNRVGGTVVVHFIKKNVWFLETALALLDMEEMTEMERQQKLEVSNAAGNIRVVNTPSVFADEDGSSISDPHGTAKRRYRRR